MSLFELAYISAARDGVSEADLAGIVAQSQLNNALKDISGILLYNGTHFAQILEGSRHEVEALFESICADPRHTSVIRIAAGPVAGRAFAGWSMKQLDDEIGIFGRESDFVRSLALENSSDRPDFANPFLSALKEMASNQMKNPQM